MPRDVITGFQFRRRQDSHLLPLRVVVTLGGHQLSTDNAAHVLDKAKTVWTAGNFQQSRIVNGTFHVAAQRSLGAVTPQDRQNARVNRGRKHHVTAYCTLHLAAQY